MNILVTGNLGYIGTVLVNLLLEKDYGVIGYDTGYYAQCNLIECSSKIRQITKDIRDIEIEDLNGIDIIIHLAGLSNDPLGELAPDLTNIINYESSMKLAQLAKKKGITRFIYASSQSMYGISDVDSELDEDNSEKNPITAYAKAKWLVENELKKLNEDSFVTVCLRPSTVFGVSPRLRCDIVFNNLVACAYTTGKIEIKSDGTPWRPVVHVRDISNAIMAAIEAPTNLVAGQAFNIGIPNGNYTVRDLAEAAQRAIPGSTLIFTGEYGNDERTYRVSFAKILSVLKDYYKPEWNLDRGAKELIHFFKDINFTEEQFRGKLCNRLQEINYLQSIKKINKDLRWNI
ncbi:MAG: NAD(P)-dependent oxidoreductase [Deltaproteobacteria bacterium]|nr:NAD(P)-dependent oxidoreductase [Deltaproteobacteria bacterium]